MFKPVDPRPNFPQLEDQILSYWKENKIFEESVESRPEDKQWTFLDGPPFITGKPHYGTLLASLPKDLFPRFWTMKGYRVRRVWGWDCHGLPAENKVENKLGLKSKKEIEEKIGIKKFIEECKVYVSEASADWEWYVDHVARWVDFKNAYRTMDTPYMESVMWVFKQLYEKKHVYKGLRVSLFCPHCSTPISNFEVAMDSNENYKDVTDLGTIYKYKVESSDDTFFLAWSTTPWNKIATPALAINPELTYVKVQVGEEKYILAETTLEILDAKYEILDKKLGSDIIGTKFELHYGYFDVDEGKQAGVIIGGDFVTAEDGTGIVTLAAYGEDDLKVMEAEKIQVVLHVDEEGHIKEDVPKFGGMYYLKANKAVNADLKERGLIYQEETYVHSMPHCWRCGTQLFYAPQEAWYVDIQNLKPRLFENNNAINWYPGHFKKGRFHKSMESAPDWCISRSRYWGSPVPVWECECNWRFVPGSLKELSDKAGQEVTDLHRPEIDDVVVSCDECGKDAHRVPEVLDSWIEAGSASFAERHYPFNNTEKVEDFFPPDFIIEYTGQIRAWFYVLHVLGTALFDSHAFKNVVVTGVLMGSDGRKMSKNYGNYPDPKEMLEKHGGDALRLYLLGSPIMKGEDLDISEEEYRNQIKIYHLPLWNVFKFFVLYANLDAYEKEELNESDVTNVLDTWILNLLRKLTKELTEDLEAYDSMGAVRKLIQFVDDLSKWYVRRSRGRVGPAASDGPDKKMFYVVMNHVLLTFTHLAAPITPFIAESLYRHLTGDKSIHLKDWPTHDEYDETLIEHMDIVRKLVETGHRIRKEQQLKVRQPLLKITFTVPVALKLSNKVSFFDQYMNLIKAELNVKGVEMVDGDELNGEYDLTMTPELEAEGQARDLVREIQKERRAMKLKQGDVINLTLPEYPESFEDYIKEKVSAKTLSKGPEIKIELIS